MGSLSGWDLTRDVVRDALLDASLLTILSSPLIYYCVVRPVMLAEQKAHDALGSELATKAEQAQILQKAMTDLKATLEINEALSARLQRSNKTIADINERTLQRIGADLHDGPAQLLTYCLLRMDRLAALAEEHGTPQDLEEMACIRTALVDTLAELRATSRGLSLPKLGMLGLKEVIMLAVTQHQEQTATKVDVTLGHLPESSPQAVNICVYRFVQESLSNAYKHAQGRGQSVRAVADGQLLVEVSDRGQGLDEESQGAGGLGLLGMRARIEAIGGQFAVTSVPGEGTTLRLIVERNPAMADEAA